MINEYREEYEIKFEYMISELESKIKTLEGTLEQKNKLI